MSEFKLNKELAKITSFSLSIKERGILMFNIFVSYENGCGQCVGGLVLDDYNESKKIREGTAYGCEMIRQLMIVLDVDDFSDAKDKLIYVLGEGEGLSFKPKGVQTLSVYGEVKTLIFSDVFNQFNSGDE